MFTIKIPELKNLLFQISQKYVSTAEAEYYTQEYLLILLKKAADEGWLEQIASDLEKWKKCGSDVKHEFSVVEDAEGTRLFDCHNLPPALRLKQLHDDLESRARKLGIAATGLFHLGGDDALSLWTCNLAKRGLIALCFVNGSTPRVVPFGGTVGMFGVNPMSYAIPTLTEPVIGDFATSQLATFRVKAGLRNQKNPDYPAVVDEAGNPSKDLEKGFSGDKSRYLPMGANYKGYEIAFLVEVLTGALVRAKMGVLEKSPAFNANECGQLLIAIDVRAFTDIEQFKKSVSAMCEEIRRQKPADFVNAVTVPGDRSNEIMKLNMKRGVIEVQESTIEKLREFLK